MTTINMSLSLLTKNGKLTLPFETAEDLMEHTPENNKVLSIHERRLFSAREDLRRKIAQLSRNQQGLETKIVTIERVAAAALTRVEELVTEGNTIPVPDTKHIPPVDLAFHRQSLEFSLALSLLAAAGHLTLNSTTFAHAMAVASVTQYLAVVSQLYNQGEAQLLFYAALLHGIGAKPLSDLGQKCSHRGEILKGAMFLRPLRFQFAGSARTIILCHQENWDGTGYPKQSAQGAIPPEARIAAAACHFDRILTALSLKNMPLEQAQSWFLAKKGKVIDPIVAEIILKDFPILCALREQAHQYSQQIAQKYDSAQGG